MKKKARKLVSSVLVAVMVGSLFTGTALATGMAKAKSASDGSFLKESSPVVFYGENMPEQTYEVASPAQAAARQASPSDAVELALTPEEQGDAEFVPDSDYGKIVIAPASTASPSNASKVTMKADGKTYESKVVFKENALETGSLNVEVGETISVPIMDSVNATSVFFNTDNIDTYASLGIENNILTVTGKQETEKPIRLSVNDGNITVGICDVTIIPATSNPDKFVFFKDKTIDLSIGKGAQALNLVEGVSFDDVQIKSSNPDIVKVETDIVNKSVKVIPVNRGTASVTATYNGETDTCQVHVTLSTDLEEEYFTEESLSVSVGQVKPLPLTASASNAIKADNAVLESEKEDVARVSEKSGDNVIYITGVKEGTSVFTVIFEDGTWDECEVSVTKEKAADFFDLPKEGGKTLHIIKGADNMQIGLTEEAMRLLEDTDEEDIVLKSDSSIVSVDFSSPDKESWDNYIYVYGSDVGTAAITLKAGNYYDTCKVIVERNIVDELENALSDIDLWTEENASEKADDIKAAVNTVSKITSSILDDTGFTNMNDYVGQLDEQTKQKLKEQINAIEKLEALLPFVNTHVVQKAIDLDKAPEAVKNLGIKAIGVGLSANLNADSETYAQLKVSEPDAGDLSGIVLSEDALALDISLIINDGTKIKDNEQPKSLIELTMEIPDALKGAELAVKHKHGSKLDEFSPVINEDGTITIYITALSTFVIDKKDVEMAEVLVKKTDGGAITAYTRSYTGDGSRMMFVPVGEEVSIPVGTSLFFETQRDRRVSSDGIELKYKDGSTETIRNHTITVTQDVTITGKFKEQTNEGVDTPFIILEMTPEYINDGADLTAKVKAYLDGDEDLLPIQAGNFKLLAAYNYEGEEVTDLFNLSSDGILKANKNVSKDQYSFEIGLDYNGVTYTEEDEYENYYYANSCILNVGVREVYFRAYLGKFSSGRQITSFVNSSCVPSGTLLKDVSSKVTVGMYGGYTADLWYDRINFSNRYPDNKPVNEDLSLYARFTKNGKAYNPEFKSLNGKDDKPAPDDQTNQPGTTHRSGGGSNGGSNKAARNSYAIYGNWEKVGNDWKFKLNNGYYAKNQWGYINGRYYYFGENATMMTGWIFVSNEWYYLSTNADGPEGAMQTGLISINGSYFYLNTSGAMQTGWQKINETWYYFNPVSDGTRGAMITNQWIGEYYVNQNGAWIK